MNSPTGLNISLPASQSTPAINADWNAGLLVMTGESYPENTYELFAQVISWVEQYLQIISAPLRVDLKLNYLNTSSIRAMIDIFDLLQRSYDEGGDVSVHWLYDSRNPRSAELGEEFKEDYSFPFEILLTTES
ncbi:biofilm regulation phosphoprotein SiaC [Synechococcus sp. CCY9201]|uniref:biofilm regulation phosphoprotein SiaC n=1 Tax=Synechococcus sp. CCY9201 TaxID=174697 RepID=UPI002B1EA1FF|nr:biofilm regulation phosphoprotein SiaC [Synechococcus sp. CCY9201]MEA5473676.1 biofilm regulation phosphoprotein SiaC [Synechococcus sp. CCY9201]